MPADSKVRGRRNRRGRNRRRKPGGSRNRRRKPGGSRNRRRKPGGSRNRRRKPGGSRNRGAQTAKCNINILDFQKAANADGWKDMNGNRLAEDAAIQ